VAAGGVEVGVSVHDLYSLTGLPLVSSRWPDNLGFTQSNPAPSFCAWEMLWPSATSF